MMENQRAGLITVTQQYSKIKKGATMKKLVTIMLVVVVLVGVTGIVHAVDSHDQETDAKLIGFGPHGSIAISESKLIITVTNPDCKRSIEIIKVYIFDKKGIPVYADIPPSLPSTLGPHQAGAILLANLPGIPSEVQLYTVEIFWSAEGKGLPLIGTTVVFQKNFFDKQKLDYTLATTRVPMENYPK